MRERVQRQYPYVSCVDALKVMKRTNVFKKPSRHIPLFHNRKKTRAFALRRRRGFSELLVLSAAPLLVNCRASWIPADICYSTVMRVPRSMCSGMNSGCVISLNTPRMHQLSNHILSRVHKRGLLRHRRLEHRLCVTARGPPIPVFVFSCLTGMCLLNSKHREVRLR